MRVFRGVARRVVALSSCDVYRACGVLHGSVDKIPVERTVAACYRIASAVIARGL